MIKYVYCLRKRAYLTDEAVSSSLCLNIPGCCYSIQLVKNLVAQKYKLLLIELLSLLTKIHSYSASIRN